MWTILAINSVTFGGLLFLLSAGFSLIFGLMRVPNLTHGSMFMLGGYIGSTAIVTWHLPFWLAAALAAAAVAVFGGVVERLLLRRLAGSVLAQVLVTLGIAFIVSDFCLSTPSTPALLLIAARLSEPCGGLFKKLLPQAYRRTSAARLPAISLIFFFTFFI